MPQIEAYNGDKWVSHFRCYFTGINHVFTHPKKSDATAIIKEYVKIVSIRYPSNHHIRFMRLDGERALGNEFGEYTKNQGITVERSASYTPTQNGNAERAGGMLTAVARAIRIHASLPSNLWPEAYRTAGYLLNRLPTKRQNWRTSF